MDLETYTNQQQLVGEEILRINRNYGKDSEDRKTVPYLAERLKNLKRIWKDFDERNSVIQNNFATQLDHPYFKKEYYEAVRKVADRLRTDLQQRLQGLQGPKLQDEEPIEDGSMAASRPLTKQREGLKDIETEQFEDRSVAGPTSLIKQGVIPPKPEEDDPQSKESSTKTSLSQRFHFILEVIQKCTDNLMMVRDKNAAFCKVKLRSLEQNWEEATTLYHKLADELTQDEISQYFMMQGEVEVSIMELLTILEAPTQHCEPAAKGTIEVRDAPMKLPQISLPKFDGNYLKWQQFSDLFTEMVHNQNIPDTQKMWFLKTSLIGEAEKLVRHLSGSGANYASAWRIIVDRYQNTRWLVSSWISRLLGQPNASTGTANTIRTLHDTTQECLSGLEGLKVDTTSWDPLLLHLLLKKLDKDSHTLYEQALKNPRALPSLKEFLAFLECRFQSLEVLGQKGRSGEDPLRRSDGVKSLVTTAGSSQFNCPSCRGSHQLFTCKEFLQLSPANRLSLVKKCNLCINCLKPGHVAVNCNSRSCFKCNKKHNSLLHLSSWNQSPSLSGTVSTPGQSSGNTKSQGPVDPSTAATALFKNNRRTLVLLGTARVKLCGADGKILECRALLDSGSQVNIISQRIIQKLGLSTSTESLYIEGIGQGKQQSSKRANVLLQSRLNDYSARIEAFVLPTIISEQPTHLLNTSAWKLPANLPLADPNFNRPDKIDLLLGAEFHYQLLAIGQIKLAEDLPILQNTVLGWVVAGQVNEGHSTTATCGVGVKPEELGTILEKFWRLEEPADDHPELTSGDKRCEAHFSKTSQRDSTGRFIVSLPFARDPTEIGESKEVALRRFYALERRLAKDAELSKLYTNFMEEYLQLGHMEEVDMTNIGSPHYFLPHHGVLKPESSTTKLRVVFDASMKTSANVSLNELLLAGPTIQDDIFALLLRFRTPRFAFTADIEKMYRQISMEKEDRKFQLILWRKAKDQVLKCYQLNTVTYGTSSAPYLATRCLKQLAKDNFHRYPLGAKILERDFYMDDVMSGSNSLSEALEMQNQLSNILRSAGFNLRKWCSNTPQLLTHITAGDQALQSEVQDKESSTIKTLGVSWNPQTDQFFIDSRLQSNNRITKRIALSEIAHIFDPLGILNPITITAKIFIQQLWKLKIDWDAALPMDLHTTWDHFRTDLAAIKDIRIPRHVFSHKIAVQSQLHAFADASGKAFGAAIYIRSTFNDGTITVHLLCSKSRVAPIKQETDERVRAATTIPRLELCAAKLATDLALRVTTDLRLGRLETYLWTDSEIVLAWIRADASRYHSFIANRVKAIQGKTSPHQWRHVPTKHNPADIVSRGVSALKLKTCNMWFYGPLYLYGPESTWPGKFEGKSPDLEKKKCRIGDTTHWRDSSGRTVLTTAVEISIVSRIDHHNSFSRLQRIIAYVKRLIHNCKTNNQDNRYVGPLSPKELDNANQSIMREVQQQAFKDELQQLSREKYVHSQSPLSSLAPFLDEEGILRVGGRLEAAELEYNAKHPILLPYNHELSKLLMEEFHLKNLHVGPQGLLAAVRQRYWPIKGKTMARSVVQKCVRCTKARPRLMEQIMGDLPAMRVQPARPFVNAGVDFFGPVWIHFRIRGKQPRKAYVAVFCCFATKATHFEVVGDLTTEAFIGAVKRFVGRRGHCRNLHCDNATNFVGASNQIKDIEQSIHSASAKEKITSFCTARSIEFHFIPPRAPHFGGLWEAAVKSAKYFLQRNLLSSNLTYEELETLMIEIEAILNSRPLTALSSDPNDLTALTPGHFLVGEPLTSTIDARAGPFSTSLNHRWKTITAIKNQFWQRWSHEYLNELQHRYKWKQRNETIRPGMLVAIKDDNLPPTQWQLGRIINCISGNDNLIRVVELRTTKGLFRRPVHKLAPLPVDDDPPLKKNPKKPSTTTLEPDTNNEVVPRKRIRQSLGATLATMLVILLTLPISQGSPVKLEPFKSHPGIYFENIAAAHILSSEWNIIAYYDMELYWQERQLVKNASSSLRNLCNKITDQVQHLEEELETNNELLSVPPSNSRKKRGALNFIGNIANSLFGVLDSEYAEGISRTIDGIQENEDLLLTRFKKTSPARRPTAWQI